MLLTDRKMYAFVIVFAALLSYMSVFEYYKVAGVVLEQIDLWHAAHINNLAPAPLQYRYLSYAFPDLLSQLLGFSLRTSYLVERYIFIWLSLITFFIFLRAWFKPYEATIQITLFIVIYNLTIFAHIQPSEEINLFIFILALLLIREQKYFYFLIVLFVGALNKDTVVFLIPIFFLYHFLQFGFSKILFLKTLLLIIIFFIIYFGIRYNFGTERDYLGGVWQYDFNKNMLLNLNLLSYNFIIPSFIPFLFIIMSWGKQNALVRAGAITLILFFLGHFLISRLEEFRTFMPMAFITIPGFFVFLYNYFSTKGDNDPRGELN